MTPKFFSHLHLVQMAFWVIMLPVALFTGLKSSVPFLITISIWALVCSEFAAWQGSMGERRQDPKDSYGEEDD
jgi:hypothetical protein